MHRDAYTCHDDYFEIYAGIMSKYIDCHPVASMTNNPPSGCHPSKPWVLSCKQQIIALSKVHNVNNTIILRQSIVGLPLVTTAHPQSSQLLSLSQITGSMNPTI